MLSLTEVGRKTKRKTRARNLICVRSRTIPYVLCFYVHVTTALPIVMDFRDNCVLKNCVLKRRWWNWKTDKLLFSQVILPPSSTRLRGERLLRLAMFDFGKVFRSIQIYLHGKNGFAERSTILAGYGSEK